MKWSVINNVLAYQADDGNTIIPDASEVFAACISHAEKDTSSLPYELIQNDLPSIRFSRIAQEVRLHLEVCSGRIIIHLYFLRRGKKIRALLQS